VRAEMVVLSHDQAPKPDALLKSVLGPGIELVAFREGGARAPLLALINAVDATVLERLAIHSSVRCDRVLVVTSVALPDEDAALLIHAGAADVLLLDAAGGERICARLERWAKVDELADSAVTRRLAVGRSLLWGRVVRKSVELALVSRLPLLLTGESGTGKEQLARLVHELDPRPTKASFVVLDCATLVAELSGSEFFGHEKGAFTGAAGERDGAFMLAHGGTLFLDEIGELPLALQGQLLRVIQDGVYKRVGGNAWRHTSFRLICATNRDLAAEVQRGRFRQDLFHRICGWTLHLPPLQERRDDILPLAEHFLAEYAKARGTDSAGFSSPVKRFLTHRAYPGNARELRQLVGRLADLHTGSGPIRLGDLAAEERGALGNGAWYDAAYVESLRRAVNSRAGLKNIMRITRRLAVETAAEEEGNNVQRMAEKLMVSRVAVYEARNAAASVNESARSAE
jgi:transcriptional regulator with GAF, ATPase, and Fis domain